LLSPTAASPPIPRHHIRHRISRRHRILFVVYTDNISGIRIIRARTANAAEIEQYEEVF